MNKYNQLVRQIVIDILEECIEKDKKDVKSIEVKTSESPKPLMSNELRQSMLRKLQSKYLANIAKMFCCFWPIVLYLV